MIEDAGGGGRRVLVPEVAMRGEVEVRLKGCWRHRYQSRVGRKMET